MLARLDPKAARKFIVTTLLMIILPIAALFITQCKIYLDLVQDYGRSWQIMMGGGAAVVTVHMVIAYFLYTVYKEEIVGEQNTSVEEKPEAKDKKRK